MGTLRLTKPASSIQDADTAGNRVLGNYIGTDATGAGRLGQWRCGYRPGRRRARHRHRRGDARCGQRHQRQRRARGGAAASRHRWQPDHGNTIGLDATGTYSLTNGDTGVFVGFAASNNVVGGENPGARNLINGGVWLQDPGTTGNRVLGNYIGTDVKGTASPGNHGRWRRSDQRPQRQRGGRRNVRCAQRYQRQC